MNKLKLTLKEEDIFIDDIEAQPSEEEINNEIFTEPVDSSIDFITSDELNEIREILLDIPDNINLLLLDDKAIILSTEEDNKTQVLCLLEDTDDFVIKELSKDIEEIMNDDTIIKYTPDNVDSRHEQVVNLLMKKLEDTDEQTTEEPEEVPEEEEDSDE